MMRESMQNFKELKNDEKLAEQVRADENQQQFDSFLKKMEERNKKRKKIVDDDDDEANED